MRLSTYILRRVAMLVPVLLGVLVLIFASRTSSRPIRREPGPGRERVRTRLRRLQSDTT